MKKTTTTPPKPKKEKWLKINVDISVTVNKDIAPKWFKAKIKKIQKGCNLTEEEATKILKNFIDLSFSNKLQTIDDETIELLKAIK